MSIRSSLLRNLEALLFSAGEPLSPAELTRCLQESIAPELTEPELDEAIVTLREYYSHEDQTFQLQLTGGGWRLLTKPEYHPTLSKYYKQQEGKRLSRAALETLSIVAYKQPVSRADVEAIRGVSSDYAINKLLERELIAIVGRDQGPGRPLLYGTSPQFMDYFGLGDISDLPKLRELVPTDNSIGDAPDITQTVAREDTVKTAQVDIQSQEEPEEEQDDQDSEQSLSNDPQDALEPDEQEHVEDEPGLNKLQELENGQNIHSEEITEEATNPEVER